jgi:hypothetical protein
MLNVYAVTVWHSSAPRHTETIEVRTYTLRRAEHLARESFPGCTAKADTTAGITDHLQAMPYLQPTPRAQCAMARRQVSE